MKKQRKFVKGYSKTIWLLIGLGVLLAFSIIFALLEKKNSIIVSEDWQTYIDPNGYFTINVPKSWKIEKNDSSVASEIKGHPFNYKTSDTTFADKTGSASISIHVDEYGSQMQKEMCSISEGSTRNQDTTFAGIPASIFDFHDWFNWTFDTANAYYQVGYYFKDHIGGQPAGFPVIFDQPTPTIFPLPKDLVDKNNVDLHHALTTFKPIPAIPYICSK